ncbi:MAG: alanine/ornithine racemase family PLP-dependent enzyme [Tenericutes bacterium]|nr:alanine/ornithine racemase family PLP-dependent enzyme [Mycoplasmatota bacterium]
MLPKIHVDLKKYAHNVNYLTKELHERSISVMAVSKVYHGDQNIINVLNESDVDYIADSRIQNLQNMTTSKPRVLLRIPKLSETDDVVLHANISLNSEIGTIRKLNQSAKNMKCIHGIVLMFDIGDLREGIYYKEDYLSIVEEIYQLEHVRLEGIGTNLTCYGGVIPEEQTYDKLYSIKNNIENHLNIKLSLISGGNSSSLFLALNQKLPKFINNLRIGEALVLGRETAYGKALYYLFDDVFTLEAEIIEIKDKPSMPEGILGMDAFGKTVKFEDRGITTRAILSIGKQDVDANDLIPPQGVIILGCSSDHLIVQISKLEYQLGDTITFKMTYGGILSLMTSPYVEKSYE